MHHSTESTLIKKHNGHITDILWEDLGTQLKSWYDNGDQIIVSGDINEKVTHTKIRAFFQQFDMTESLSTKHPFTPETHIKNNNYKTIDGIWTTPGVSTIACGYLSYDEWDHRPIWMDVEEVELLVTENCQLPRFEEENSSSPMLNILKITSKN